MPAPAHTKSTVVWKHAERVGEWAWSREAGKQGSREKRDTHTHTRI